MHALELEPVRFKISVNNDAEAFHDNVKINVARKVPRLQVKQIAIVAGGPSAADHLDEIRRFQTEGGDVLAINGAALWLISNGIRPDYGLIYDSRAENAEFLTIGPHWLIASHAHPSVFEKAWFKSCAVTMFHSSGHEGVEQLIRSLEPRACILGGTSTGGLQALSLAAIMGYKVARLYGYDSSARDGAKHAYDQPLNADQKLQEIHFEGKLYHASAVMAEQAKLFAETYEIYENIGLSITVIGDGLLPAMWHYMEANKGPIVAESLEAVEAAKYKHIWGKDTYRRFSPGEQLLEKFLSEMDPRPDLHRIIDFGCGPGRATAKLQQMGFSVLGVDIADNCLDHGLTVPLCIANLWQLPETVKGSHGLCCDVMEHIPPHLVDAVLANIAGAVSMGCFFNISFRPDTHGDKRTGPLHLTVKSLDWWTDKLHDHFPTVTPKGGGTFTCLK